MSDTSLKKKTANGLLWSFVERFSVQGVQFAVMIVMARILTPGDYGLVGMLAIFIGIAQSLVDSGFPQALIRTRDRTPLHDSTMFWFNLGMGIIFYWVLYFSAPLIARFYGSPELTELTRVIGLIIPVNAATLVPRAHLSIKVDFKTQARASLCAAFLSGGAGITLAYSGFGYWAIVGQQLTSVTTESILLWVFTHWKPTLRFSRRICREFFGFGSRLALSGLIDTIYNNMYVLVIGKVFKAADVGYYTRAYQFASFPSVNVTTIIQRVSFPVLSSLQGDDERLAGAYRRFLRLTAFLVFPAMCILSAAARPFILFLLTPDWEPTAILLTILCIYLMWFPIHAINLNIPVVKGKSGIYLRLEIIKKVIGVALLVATIPFGVTMMCWGLVAYSLLSLYVNTYYSGKLIGVGLWRQLRDMTPTLLRCAAVWGVTYACTFIPVAPGWQLLGAITAGASLYLLLVLAFKAPEISELKDIISRRKPQHS